MLRATLIAFLCFVGAAAAQTPAHPIRGLVAEVSGDTVEMTARTGERVTVHLMPNTRFLEVVPASRADLKPGSFIGVAAVPEGDGLTALEVHVFPEALRGTGEGHRPFDLAPNSTMTNGSVNLRVTGSDGDEITVAYKGGSKTIRLPKNVPIVAFAPGDRADLKPGANAIARVSKGADGALEARDVLVGRDGLVPPM